MVLVILGRALRVRPHLSVRVGCGRVPQQASAIREPPPSPAIARQPHRIGRRCSHCRVSLTRMPIGMAANLFVSVIGIICFVLTRKDTIRLARGHLKAARTANTFAVVLFVVLCVFALSETLDQPKVDDAGLYHFQTMKWIAHYGSSSGRPSSHEVVKMTVCSLRCASEKPMPEASHPRNGRPCCRGSIHAHLQGKLDALSPTELDRSRA